MHVLATLFDSLLKILISSVNTLTDGMCMKMALARTCYSTPHRKPESVSNGRGEWRAVFQESWWGWVCGGAHWPGEARNVTLHRQRNSCTVRGGKWDKAGAIKEQDEVAEIQMSVKELLLTGLRANRSLLHLSKHPSHLWGVRMENMLLQGINSAHHCEHSVEIGVCEVGMRFAKFKYSHQKNKRSHKHQADFKDFVIYPCPRVQRGK